VLAVWTILLAFQLHSSQGKRISRRRRPSV
jgi:hypothetical protein